MFQNSGVKSTNDPEEHPIFLTEAPLTANNREIMTRIMFDTFNVPALYVAVNAVASLVASGRFSGVVLDSGFGATHSVPIYEGCLIRHSTMKMSLGGKDITEYLMPFKIKEKLCYVALDYEDELLKSETSEVCEREYELPDGSKMMNNSELFRAPEILFKPSFLFSEDGGIHETIYNSIIKSDKDMRSILFKNIVLSGDSTMFTGIKERLQYEILRLAPINTNLRIISPQSEFSSWVGGSIISSSNFEFIRTKTLVKGIVVLIDVLPFRRWYEKEYNRPMGKVKSVDSPKTPTPVTPADAEKQESKVVKMKQKHEIDHELSKYLPKGKVLALITSRPGQCGEVQGRILEGNELAFYVKVLQRKRLLK